MSAITRTLMKTVEEKADQGDAAEIMLLVYETIIKAESRGRLHMYLLQEAVVGNTELKKTLSGSLSPVARYDRRWIAESSQAEKRC